MTDLCHQARERLSIADSVLLMVDLQAKLLPRVRQHEEVVRRTRLLLRAAQVLGLPRLLTTQYARGLGPTVPEVLELAEDLEPVDKTCFGCFGSSGFRRALATLAAGRSTLIVVGIETHICVLQTVLEGLEQGYRVHVPADATSSRGEPDRERGLRRMERAGALVTTAETAVYELLGASDTAAFKALLPELRERG